MIPYATTTGTEKNLDFLRRYGWSLLLTPDIYNPHDFDYAIDNGAWGAYQRDEEFPEEGFLKILDLYGQGADWIAVPDIVQGGVESLKMTDRWMGLLDHYPLRLVVIQDDYELKDIEDWLKEDGVGIFLGGGTEWKLQSMPFWGDVANHYDCYYHVGRVNSRKRIKMCYLAGADSFDGTSCSKYSSSVLPLTSEVHQPTLWSSK